MANQINNGSFAEFRQFLKGHIHTGKDKLRHTLSEKKRAKIVSLSDNRLSLGQYSKK